MPGPAAAAGLRPSAVCSPSLIADLDDTCGRAIRADNLALQLLTRYIGIPQEAGTFAVR
jgi:hypothetical protein